MCFCSCSFCLRHLGHEWEVQLHEAAEMVCVASTIAPSCSGDQEALCRCCLLLRRQVRLELPAPRLLQACSTDPRAACCSRDCRRLLRAWCCCQAIPDVSEYPALLVQTWATCVLDCWPRYCAIPTCQTVSLFTLCVYVVPATVGPPAPLLQTQIINSNVEAIYLKPEKFGKVEVNVFGEVCV